MSWIEVAVVAAVALLGATLQGSIGFGMGLLASPVLILFDPRFVPAPILCATMVLTSLLAWRERHAIDIRGVGWALAGRLAGTVAAGGVLLAVPGDRLVLLFGLFILAGVGMSVAGRRFAPVRSTLVTAGVLSGLLGTVASIGGPPMALIYQHASGPRIRSTMSTFFLVGTVASLVALRAVGRFGADEVRLAGVLLPSMLAGFALSRRTAPWIDRGWIRPAALATAGLTGFLVVLRQLV